MGISTDVCRYICTPKRLPQNSLPQNPRCRTQKQD